MGSIRKEIVINASADAVWDAIRDYGQVHRRLVSGFVVETELEGDERIVTFANGLVQREPLVDCDDALRRLVYTVKDPPNGATHYNGSAEVFPSDDQTRVEWTVDFLPHTLRERIDQAMELGAKAMRQTLESAGS